MRVEPGLMASPVAAVLRLGDGRNLPGRPRRRLARVGLGPERRHARGHARRRRRRGDRGPLGRPTCSGSPTAARWASPRAPRWRTSRASRRPARACSAMRGWDVATLGLTGAPRVRIRRGRGAARLGRPRAAAFSGSATRSSWTADDQGRIHADALERRAGRGRGARDRGAAGGQHPLRRLRPVRASASPPPRGRRLDPRRRRVRAVGGRLAASAAPVDGCRGRGLVGDRCAQDPQRAVRLRDRDRRGMRRPCAPRWACTRATWRRPLHRRRPARARARALAPRAGRARLGRAALAGIGRRGRVSSTASPMRPGGSRTGSPRCPASRCSTTSCSPRSASRCRRMPRPARWPTRSAPRAWRSHRRRAGATGRCCGSR